MEKYIKAVECAEIISQKFNIPLGDLVDAFAEIPTADVVPISEVEKLKAYLEIWKQNRFNLYQRLECYKMAREKVAREIFEDIENHCDHIVVHLDTNASPETFKSVITQVCDAFAGVLAELEKKYQSDDINA